MHLKDSYDHLVVVAFEKSLEFEIIWKILMTVLKYARDKLMYHYCVQPFFMSRDEKNKKSDIFFHM